MLKSQFNYPICSPLEQFEIQDYLKLVISIYDKISLEITNIGVYLSFSLLIILLIYLLPDFDKIISNKWSIALESLYVTILSIVKNQINSKKGQKYFPFIFTLFTFILVNNLIGMTPYSFSTTSHFILTFAISFTIVLGATILGFFNHSLKFFGILVPKGCPILLLILLVLIELISYLARNISLGLRLAANILSGHMLLNILAGFTYKIMTKGVFFFLVGLLPLSFIVAFSGLELGIAFIQAQVFVVLTCSYIKDGLDMH